MNFYPHLKKLNKLFPNTKIQIKFLLLFLKTLDFYQSTFLRLSKKGEFGISSELSKIPSPILALCFVGRSRKNATSPVLK